MHRIVVALTQSKLDPADEKQMKLWLYANKVCRHTSISNLSNEISDVFCSYKKAKQI